MEGLKTKRDYEVYIQAMRDLKLVVDMQMADYIERWEKEAADYNMLKKYKK
jgi:hypothetical protein